MMTPCAILYEWLAHNLSLCIAIAEEALYFLKASIVWYLPM